MKITRFLSIIFLAATAFGHAQDISDNTIGLRLGDSDGFGAEISYQKALGRSNRAELGLGWRDSREYDAFKLSGTYQWVQHLDGGFNWYYGVGASVGSADFEPVPNGDDNDGLFLGAAGIVGIEYAFDIPLLISLDTRPEIGLLGYDGFDNGFLLDIALGVRYQF